ncbi:hypothetical protein T4B_12886 [Trichinella pseudospiralis]|uniref:Uncharacterized protein n=1 Tax=Trichinella pseudospiralis TaxID=6337 RepID=A0A0V1GUV5_TRIPS|nr:hypothetical protein T4B_12886 [Trichinella pseudospiralis]
MFSQISMPGRGLQPLKLGEDHQETVVRLWLSTFEHFHIPCLVQLKWQRKVARNVRYCHMHDAAMLISNDESP